MPEAERAPAGRLAGLRPIWRKLARPSLRPGRPRSAEGVLPLSVVIPFAGLFIAGAMIAFDPIGLDAVGTWSRQTMRLFRIITDFGDSAVYLVPLGVALAVLGLWRPVVPKRVEGAMTEIWLRLAFVFLAVAGTGLSVNVGKRLIGRVRPLHVDPGAVWHFEPLGWKAASASFPSGHATTAFTVVTAVFLLSGPGLRRRMLPWLTAGAVLVCVSRVVIGAHFPSDVMAGAMFGALGSWWFAHFLARRRLVFLQTATGALALRGALAPKTLRAFLAAKKVS